MVIRNPNPVTNLKVGDLIYYISNWDDNHHNHCVVTKIEIDDYERIRVWGNWCRSKKEALKLKKNNMGWMELKDVYLEHTSWKEKLK